ncbi:Dam family site-specific DNA-(adenine-N6)-methyltransferase [Algicola sagamiensis]|uniref:Dam family site-specific DNA-(adenine-N6)-methyltransferase n=1 Tax=Algicola sagamiensis TaxID=163869 RepID=UPI00035D94BD|nr:Dam family site-specific DNA-(adenine-N6)-methyltransferase [Algicola sagamiensis]
MAKKKYRAFLKWAGGKYALVEDIAAFLPKEGRLVEPFVGAGSVFLNTDFESYVLNDINKDLIHLYQLLQTKHDVYIAEARKLFSPENNQKNRYLEIRAAFNASRDTFERSLLFLYLNRHGYNGLCRYNLKGGFNVPFGSYKKPYFPEKELHFFAEKSQKAEFTCMDYKSLFNKLKTGDIVYCDPPYVPLSKTASFTTYAGNGFSLDDQAELANQAEQASFGKGIPVLISNHDTTLTRKIYEQATDLKQKYVGRTISQKGHTRQKVKELFAMYHPQSHK